jgi:hypothetical protein
MGMEIIMKARGSLRIHDDNITYTQTTEIENTLSFQASLTLKFEGFSLGFPRALLSDLLNCRFHK